MERHINRREFIEAVAAAGVFTIVPRHVLGGAGHVAPSDKITLAQIGMGTQAFRELGGLLAEPRIQIVAVCDPNTDSNNYVEWGKGEIRRRIRGYMGKPNWRENDSGCPGGREVGRAVVDAYYARQRGAEKFKACAAWADFREMLAQQKDLDAVKILTPDHLHATLSIAAMTKGKHVLLHKPIANRLYEGRRVVETARKTKVATHLLAYGSGDGIEQQSPATLAAEGRNHAPRADVGQLAGQGGRQLALALEARQEAARQVDQPAGEGEGPDIGGVEDGKLVRQFAPGGGAGHAFADRADVDLDREVFEPAAGALLEVASRRAAQQNLLLGGEQRPVGPVGGPVALASGEQAQQYRHGSSGDVRGRQASHGPPFSRRASGNRTRRGLRATLKRSLPAYDAARTYTMRSS